MIIQGKHAYAAIPKAPETLGELKAPVSLFWQYNDRGARYLITGCELLIPLGPN